MRMDPLDLPDPGSLGQTLNGITGTVRAAKELGAAVVEDSSFELVLPVVWALIVLVALSRVLKFFQGWSDAGARRYGDGQRVLTFRTPKAYEDEIRALKATIADMALQLAELTGGNNAPQPKGETNVEANQSA